MFKRNIIVYFLLFNSLPDIESKYPCGECVVI